LKIKKLVKEMLNLPGEMRLEKVKKVLTHFGWVPTNTKGDHFMYRKGGEMLTLVVRKGRFIEKVYIKRVIDRLNLEEWYEKQK